MYPHSWRLSLATLLPGVSGLFAVMSAGCSPRAT